MAAHRELVDVFFLIVGLLIVNEMQKKCEGATEMHLLCNVTFSD